MSKKPRLELTWIGKENRPRLEPRILLERPGEVLSREASRVGQGQGQGRLQLAGCQPSRSTHTCNRSGTAKPVFRGGMIVTDFPGARWWRFDFHNHTPASSDFPDKNVTPEAWLRAYIQAGIQCVAITDHNTGAWIERLRNAKCALVDSSAINDADLILFPGVEVSVNHGVHMLVLFDPEAPESRISELLGAVGFRGTQGDSNAVTSVSVEDFIRKVAELGGICIAAHADLKKGLVHAVTDATTLDQLSKLCGHGLLALQLSDLDAPSLAKMSEPWKKLARVKGSDSHELGTAGKDSSWIKMGTPNLDGLRLALLDPDYAVRECIPNQRNPNETPRLWIRGLEIQDTKLRRASPLTVTFNPWFNAIIGGRGSGKSSLIEFLRLGLRQDDKFQRQVNGPMQSVAEAFKNFARPADRQPGGALLQATRVTVEIQRESMASQTRWQYDGGLTAVLDQALDAWQPVPESISDDYVRNRFPVTVLSQKQIFALAEQRDFLLGLIDQAPTVDRGTWDGEYRALQEQFFALRAQARQMMPDLANRANLEAEEREIERKLKALELSHHAELLKKYQRAQRLSAEQGQLLHRWRADVEVVRNAVADADLFRAVELRAFAESNADESEYLKVVKETETALRREYQVIEQAVKRLEVSVEAAASRLASLPLQTNLQQVRQEYASLLQNLKSMGVESPDQYAVLVTRKQNLQQQIKKLDERGKQQQLIEQQTVAALERIKTKRQELTQRRQKFIDDVIKPATTAIKLKLRPYGSAKAAELEFRDYIKQPGTAFEEDILNEVETPNGPIARGVLARLYSDPSRMETELQALKDEIVQLRAEPGRHTDLLGDKVHRKLIQHLESGKLSPQDIDRLLAWFPEDGLELEVELQPGKYRAVDEASAGQKSVAVLALLLAFGDHPLIVDQPEDDLDNAMVMDLVVKQIILSKPRRQLIIVTHNANVVVNADADLVIPMEFRKGQIGLIDDEIGGVAERGTRKAICRIMEGGERAFQLRYKKILEDLR